MPDTVSYTAAISACDKGQSGDFEIVPDTTSYTDAMNARALSSEAQTGASGVAWDIVPLAQLPKGTQRRRRKKVQAMREELEAMMTVAAARARAKAFSLRDVAHLEELSGITIGATVRGKRLSLSRRQQRIAWTEWGIDVNRYEGDIIEQR